MTSKERWIAALKMQPLDRIPFWPKINSSYTRHQSEDFKNMELQQLHNWIGSDKHQWLNRFIKENNFS
ncbi:MAG: uroporphyrinogen decarboxylase family protein [Candidatus Omnitrophica bacterium]|nr:uroporphyrinogen decarboxylase family protein [Candidatus Omnitrophota bacterium]MCM8822661.1 uroporphyrinogen decarboxylase family protein [Candidatus Omnitrophota bacterium]MCM8825669.1 uroporphyrinogen decarboxylase family protein [Candidatus Omnitrophota bacterium]MCM8827836.1 uroporphyrinogen decarboxylase family protein [Candidatus Omnitrophota bacterium]